ncbi:MAG: hypothetical protein ACTIMA_04435, partial [Brachybacterium tyrofermentans]
MTHPDVHAISRSTDLRLDVVPPVADALDDGVLEGRFGIQAGGARRDSEDLEAARGELEIVPKQFDVLVQGRRNAIPCHRREHDHGPPSSRDADVEAATAALPVEGPEHGGDLACFVRAVADGEEDDVAF